MTFGLQKKYLAHVRQNNDSIWLEHDLVDHLQQVAIKAANYASSFKSSDWAYLAGLWHDLGKFSIEFQNYIKSKSGYDPEAHLENSSNRVDHSTAGAIHSIKTFKTVGRILAYLIAGHHAGLPDWVKGEAEGNSLENRLMDEDLLHRVLKECLPQDILDSSSNLTQVKFKSIALWIRMLFSCLVDADFLDTEQFMDHQKSAIRSDYFTIAELKLKFDEHITDVLVKANKTSVNQIRAEVLRQCCHAANQQPGLFSLTVPTGGGKTLSSLAFALNHAQKHHKNRIIYVIPYTSIIEQTADTFREIFKDQIVEHHCNLDSDKETDKTRLASENWDAPIIVTTNVQFFESLFAAKTSRTRKLHNIVNSVVILDEAQILPVEFLKPILSVIQELTENYRVSFVLTTATQPALNERCENGFHFKGLRDVREIINDVPSLYNSLKRVEFIIPKNLSEPKSWEKLAQELQRHTSVLCIVNSRADCRELFKLMPAGTLHLSGLMCGEHRSNVIRQIKNLLQNDQPIRVISTQLVEAGVDIDFPVIYRALAGLDSISQAAGRCNREGKLTKSGDVFIFVPPKPAPAGILRKGEQISRELLEHRKADPLEPAAFQDYFKQLYWKANSLDKHQILDLLEADAKRLKIQFRTAASKFKIIDDSVYSSLIVSYNNSNLLENLRQNGPSRLILRKLQRFVITLPKSYHIRLLNQGHILEMHPGIYVQVVPSQYDNVQGFVGDIDPSDFIF